MFRSLAHYTGGRVAAMHIDDFFKETSTVDPWGAPALVVRSEAPSR